MNESMEVRFDNETIAVYCSNCARHAHVADDEVAVWVASSQRRTDTYCDDCSTVIVARHSMYERTSW